MFARTEAKDEEAVERADIIQTLYAIKGSDEFTSINLHEHLADSARKVECGITEELGTTELRRFCTPKLARAPSPKSISHNLQAIVDAPVSVMAGTARLRSYADPHTKQRRFSVELTPHSEQGE